MLWRLLLGLWIQLSPLHTFKRQLIELQLLPVPILIINIQIEDILELLVQFQLLLDLVANHLASRRIRPDLRISLSITALRLFIGVFQVIGIDPGEVARIEQVLNVLLFFIIVKCMASGLSIPGITGGSACGFSAEEFIELVSEIAGDFHLLVVMLENGPR